jgi:type IV secretion system protein VirB8
VALKKDQAKTKVETRNWYNDRYQFVLVQRNILAILTAISLLCSVAASFSISQLAPLKSVEPFVIQVDQKTGVTQVVNPLKVRELTGQESINNYFLVQYIRARESFLGTPDRNYFNYNLVRVLSGNDVFDQYQKDIILSNPDSPGARLGARGARDVQIGSIKLLDKRDLPGGEESRRYLVKVRITEKASNAGGKILQQLILIEFKYTELDLTVEDRYLNPIGFRVLGYRVDNDNLSQ